MNNITEGYILADQACRELSLRLHAGQKDKGGNDYFASHIEKVVDYVGKLAPQKPGLHLRCVAYLHDVIEDCDLTLGELQEELISNGVSYTITRDIALDVAGLSKDKNISYMKYIELIAESYVLSKVKIADLVSNMDLSRLKRKPSPYDLVRQGKYLDSLVYLLSKDNEK